METGTIAAAVALELARRGLRVHLSTTDPAAHLVEAVAAVDASDGGDSTDAAARLPNLTLGRIDPAAETARYAAEVMTSARVGYRKPHPRIFEAAAAMAGEPVEALLYVGDNVAHDVEGARAVPVRLTIGRTTSGAGHLFVAAFADIGVS